MTNGYPLAAIIGRGDIMTAAEDTFISSTFWTERLALAATVTAIREFDRLNAAAHMEYLGKIIQEGWIALAKKHGLSFEVGGIYPMSHFSFDGDNALIYKTYFTQEMLKRGYLASTMFYTSYAHNPSIVETYLDACDEVFASLAELLGRGADVGKALKGPVCHIGFQRLN
jgi:glutamate-1-semialdehyde aminotransferase